MKTQDLPFWHFFQQLEKELSYERWIDKYQLFLQAVYAEKLVTYDDDWSEFRRFCKILYLQNINDEQRFDRLITEAIRKEKNRFEMLAKHVRSVAEKENGSKIKDTDSTDAAPPVKDTTEKSKEIVDKKKEEPYFKEPADERKQKTVFYEPVADGFNLSQSTENTSPVNYLLTDEYFPVTRREMVKGWQFLRQTEKGKTTEGLDIKNTVEKWAREGLFLEPVFTQGVRNREDTLIIFADCRGSMTPFHELTNRLVKTAVEEGGHPNAPVYYYQNFPVGYVYSSPDMNTPVKLKEALSKCNRNITTAIIISDAGAARGNRDTEHIRSRLAITTPFLKELANTCSKTIWLNPMPMHRWAGTAAQQFRDKVFMMAPIFDNINFPETFRAIVKQNLRNIKMLH
jgi:uncharacterized protein with von Willebrand factor type A (vWA) domain